MEFRSEAEFQRSIVDHAEASGWLAHYLPDWMYRLAIASLRRQRRADRPWPTRGFPDLVLAHPQTGRLIVAECKLRRGRVSDAQRRWLRTIKRAGVETYVWRPADLDTILDILYTERIAAVRTAEDKEKCA